VTSRLWQNARGTASPEPGPHGSSPDPHGTLTSGEGAVRDSVTVGTWTAVSRGTGVLRVLLLAAVLGPTYLGNTYQLTNALPNLVFYGFLGGSLFASLLVPSLVGYLDLGSRRDVERVTGAFLGVTLAALAVLTPIALLVLPLLLQLMTPFSDSSTAGEQVQLARWLILMTMPQVLGYAVAGICAAVMNAQRRYALAAAAPAVENLGIIGVLLAVAVLYGSRRSAGMPPDGELLLLGLGSTAAVGVHAALQWWGARRCGVRLRPRLGWRITDVQGVLRRAVPSLIQSALLALQILAILVVASTVAGGTVALQIALNFYALPIALVATPVALSLLPRLSRLVHASSAGDFSDTFIRGLRLALFLTLPAATGYLVLAGPIAASVAGGRMATPDGVRMISWALASVACGLVGQSVFFVTSQAAYARRDMRKPLRSTILQCVVCLAGCGIAVQADGLAVLVILGISYSVANVVGALHLLNAMRRHLHPATERWAMASAQVAVGCLAMALVTLGASRLVEHLVDGRPGAVLSLAAGCLAGLFTFGFTQHRWRSQEAAWLIASLAMRRPWAPRTRTINT
jgi:putative peptidoglycan lipid II flippase